MQNPVALYGLESRGRSKMKSLGICCEHNASTARDFSLSAFLRHGRARERESESETEQERATERGKGTEGARRERKRERAIGSERQRQSEAKGPRGATLEH